MTDPGPSRVEPGILQLFRIFVALEILLLVLRMGLEAAFRSDFPLVRPAWPGLTFLALQLGYLSWRRSSSSLGRFYLPIALVASVGLTVLSAATGFKLRLEAGIRAEELVRGSWILIVVLLVPLIIVAWQYGFRWVLWFCALTVATELALTLPLADRGGPPALTLVMIALGALPIFPAGGLRGRALGGAPSASSARRLRRRTRGLRVTRARWKSLP